MRIPRAKKTADAASIVATAVAAAACVLLAWLQRDGIARSWAGTAEGIMAWGIILDLGAAAIVLVIRLVVLLLRPKARYAGIPGIGPTALRRAAPWVIIAAAWTISAVLVMNIVFVNYAFPTPFPSAEVLAVVLGIAVLITAGFVVVDRPGEPAPPVDGALTVLGAVYAGICALACLLLTLLPAAILAVKGWDQRYLNGGTAFFHVGVVWVLGLVFTLAGHRPGRGRLSAVLWGLSLAALGAVALVAAAAAQLYGADLTE